MKWGFYTTQLQAGLGMIEETSKLFDYWNENSSVSDLYNSALKAGAFPNVTARRLRNIIAECFAPRFMKDTGVPANVIKEMLKSGRTKETEQLYFLATARANKILYDFVSDVFWTNYATFDARVSKEDSILFIRNALSNGKMKTNWSDGTISRVSGYLLGCLSDFGLIDNVKGKSARKIITFRPLNEVVLVLAYDLHFRGFADNSLISHSDWQLFGMKDSDVKDELKRLSRNGYLIIQTASDVVRISWSYKTWEELMNVITKG